MYLPCTVHAHTCMPVWKASTATVESLHKDTPEMRTSPLIQDTTYQIHREVYKTTPEMRTPPLIRTLEAVWNRGVPLYT